ncbi:hypothetical protein BJX70DRAFT_194065 [Aspergillus crustosus]
MRPPRGGRGRLYVRPLTHQSLLQLILCRFLSWNSSIDVPNSFHSFAFAVFLQGSSSLVPITSLAEQPLLFTCVFLVQSPAKTFIPQPYRYLSIPKRQEHNSSQLTPK